ncbi:superoxide dismutase [Prunus yedoensis var. nudiflora]|uniref:Superoxide dismutase n=1 Tax=Prunus yedoensis var. nudiflora TaxID=2094558 RepID=A0A314ZQH6_PRUYE|nr:superoxide dismutase [Prunus yedoensis var. nudiflora]
MALRTVRRRGLAGLSRNGGGLGLGLGLVTVRGLKTFTLPDLPYDYGALVPYISGEIMQLHHQKHHQTYVTNFNNALEHLDQAMAKGHSPTIVKLQSVIKFNGGGHINHSVFWKNLTPVREGGGEPPKGSLARAVENQFALDSLIQKVNVEGAALQGSGWWLALDKDQKRLSIETTFNQDSGSLVAKGSSYVPLLGIDVWEHAYTCRLLTGKCERRGMRKNVLRQSHIPGKL